MLPLKELLRRHEETMQYLEQSMKRVDDIRRRLTALESRGNYVRALQQCAARLRCKVEDIALRPDSYSIVDERLSFLSTGVSQLENRSRTLKVCIPFHLPRHLLISLIGQPRGARRSIQWNRHPAVCPECLHYATTLRVRSSSNPVPGCFGICWEQYSKCRPILGVLPATRFTQTRGQSYQTWWQWSIGEQYPILRSRPPGRSGENAANQASCDGIAAATGTWSCT